MPGTNKEHKSILSGIGEGLPSKQTIRDRSCFLDHTLLFFSLKSIREVKSLSHVRLFATPWTVAYQAPLSVGFSRQEYWSGFPFIQLL